MFRPIQFGVAFPAVVLAVVAAGCGKSPLISKAAAAEQISNVAEFDQPPKVGLGSSSAEAPMSLSCSDGSGLELRELRVRAVLDGPLALTQAYLTFHNPDPRQREGRFSITLPPGAAVSRFAMQVDGRWMEGEMVEKQRARRIYEDYLHRRQDPAILEQDAGNVFQARVFPIPASGDKHLVIAWSQELADANAPYTLPLVGLPKMRKLQIAVHVHAGRGKDTTPVLVEKAEFQPPVDLLVRRSALGQGEDVARAGDLLVARFQVPAQGGDHRFGRLVVLFDTSASEAIGFEARIERLRQLLGFAADKGATEATVVLFDQVTATAYSGPPKGLDDLAAAKIQARGAMGASDLGLALAKAAEVAKAGGPSRLVVLTNAMPTAGLTEAKALAEQAKSLAAAGVERLDVVTQSGARDEALAKALTTAGLKNAGTVLAIGSGKADFAALGRATLNPLDISVEGAEWVYPEHVDGVQPGEWLLVYAGLPAATQAVVKVAGGATFQPKLAPRELEGALLERAAVGARIRRLEAQQEAAKDELAAVLKDQIVDLSVRNRVLSRHTALLVLENDGEYARYKIDQKALANILFVTGDGRAVLADRVNAYGLVEVAKRQPDGRDEPGQEELRPGKALEMRDPEPHEAGGADSPAPTVRREEAARDRGGNLDRDLERAAPASAGGAPGAPAPAAESAPRSEERKARAAKVESKSIAGAFRDLGGSTKFFQEAGEGEPGDAVAKNFGGAGGSNADGDRPAARVRIPAASGERGVQIRMTAETTGSGEGKADIARVVSRKNSAIQRCFEAAKRENPNVSGKVKVTFTVGTEGMTVAVGVAGATGPFADCIRSKFESIRGLPTLSSPQTFTQNYVFVVDEGLQQGSPPSGSGWVPPPPPPPPQKRPHAQRAAARWVSAPNTPEPPGVRYERLSEGLRANAAVAVLAEAKAWRKEAPTELLALVILGRAHAAAGEPEQAARAFGSIIDLYPGRADLRRYAGNLLESTGAPGLALALDSYRVALKDRPDHPSVFHATAMALARAGRYLDAIDVAVEGLSAPKRSGNFNGSERILQDDIHQLAAAFLAQDPNGVPQLLEHAKTYAPAGLDPGKPADGGEANLKVAQALALVGIRFILTWETDANDVDFHVVDAYGEEGSYRNKRLRSGGELYTDITSGYGPESFAIAKPCGFPYLLWAHYYRMGPMGFGMGRVQAIRFDGKTFAFDERPFAITRDRADVQLGEFAAAADDPAECPQFRPQGALEMRK